MDIFIAENLKTLRQENGYTLEGLADIIDVTRQTVAKWENRESLPDIVNCIKLAALFKMTLDSFVLIPYVKGEDVNTAPDSEKLMGVLDINEGGSIQIPGKVLDMFDMKNGEQVMLLADKNQGIALVKCSRL